MVKHGLVWAICVAIVAMAVLFLGACAPTVAPVPATSATPSPPPATPQRLQGFPELVPFTGRANSLQQGGQGGLRP